MQGADAKLKNKGDKNFGFFIKMKIGIDLDECISEFTNGFLKIYNDKFKKNFLFGGVHSYNLWEVVGGTREEALAIADEFYNSSEFDNIGLVDGAKEAIKKLSKKHQLFIITSRPAYIRDKTNNFIKNHFPNDFSEIIYTGDFFSGQGKTKAEVCKALGIGTLIEDNFNYALSCAEQGIDVLLLNKPWNKNAAEHSNIKRVGSWNEILGQINEKTDSHEEIIEKVKKFVEEECKKPTSHYGSEIFIYHFAPMHSYAKKLAEQLNADIEVVELAAWLHDIGSIMRGRKDLHITGAEIAEKKLRELGYPENKIEKVKKCILNHRGSVNIQKESAEEQIIADADALSAFDNISGLFEAAIFHEGFNQMQARIEVRRKLTNSWQKLSPIARKMVEHKYLAAMILLGES